MFEANTKATHDIAAPVGARLCGGVGRLYSIPLALLGWFHANLMFGRVVG